MTKLTPQMVGLAQNRAIEKLKGFCDSPTYIKLLAAELSADLNEQLGQQAAAPPHPGDGSLVPCPFDCDNHGGRPVIEEGGGYQVFCNACNARGPIRDTPEHAIEEWERRAVAPPPPSEAEYFAKEILQSCSWARRDQWCASINCRCQRARAFLEAVAPPPVPSDALDLIARTLFKSRGHGYAPPPHWDQEPNPLRDECIDDARDVLAALSPPPVRSDDLAEAASEAADLLSNIRESTPADIIDGCVAKLRAALSPPVRSGGEAGGLDVGGEQVRGIKRASNNSPTHEGER